MAEHEGLEPSKGSSLVKRAYEAANRDGMLAAAWRQGADEMGQALKAFPDSIGVDEPGTLLNPTQGEVAAARKSPSEIARDKSLYVPEPGQERDNGMER